MYRSEVISGRLHWLQSRGLIHDWWVNSPDGTRRWHIIAPCLPGYGRTYSTREVEAFIEGASMSSTTHPQGCPFSCCPERE